VWRPRRRLVVHIGIVDRCGGGGLLVGPGRLPRLTEQVLAGNPAISKLTTLVSRLIGGRMAEQVVGRPRLVAVR
jgi:hypothetical protein